MKTLKQVCAASVLTLALSLSAFAGEIETTFTTPPQSATMMGEDRRDRHYSHGHDDRSLSPRSRALAHLSGTLG